MLNWYLAEEKKTVSGMRSQLEEVTVVHEGYEKYQVDLLAKLDQAHQKRKETVKKARITQLKGDPMVDEYKKLKVKMDGLPKSTKSCSLRRPS